MGSKVAAKTEKSDESLSYVTTQNVELTQPETFREKFIRKTKENPLVPIGVFTHITLGACLKGVSVKHDRTASTDDTAINWADGTALHACLVCLSR